MFDIWNPSHSWYMSGISQSYLFRVTLVYVWYIPDIWLWVPIDLQQQCDWDAAAAAHVFWVSRVFIVQRQRWLATTGGGNARAATDAAQCAQHHWHDQLRWFQCRSSSNHRKISRWCTHRTCTVLGQEVKSNPKANSKIQPPKVRSARPSDRNQLALNFQMQSLQNWNQQREYKPWNWQPEDN